MEKTCNGVKLKLRMFRNFYKQLLNIIEWLLLKNMFSENNCFNRKHCRFMIVQCVYISQFISSQQLRKILFSTPTKVNFGAYSWVIYCFCGILVEKMCNIFYIFSYLEKNIFAWMTSIWFFRIFFLMKQYVSPAFINHV